MEGRTQAIHPSAARAGSRASASFSRTRTTSQTTVSSHSQSAAPQNRRRNDTQSYGSAIGRSPSRHSRAASEDSRQTPAPAVSALLQETLERERKAHAARRPARNNAMRAPDDSALLSSPMRGLTEEPRPGSSGNGAHSRQNMGLKEMEQIMSNLHKQNFDLKLELHHRREKQGALEAQLEAMVQEKEHMEKMTAQLLKRQEDSIKAVREAADMIVRLESRVQELLEEREMVRQVEAEDWSLSEVDLAASTPKRAAKFQVVKSAGPELCRPDAEKAVKRVPSFVSDRSAATENLRRVYLGTQSSPLVLQNQLDNVPEPEVDQPDSPEQSVLSESSFLSVYGQKDDAFPLRSAPGSVDGPSETHRSTSSGTRRSLSCRNTSRSAPLFHSISSLVDEPPLKRLETVDTDHHPNGAASAPLGCKTEGSSEVAKLVGTAQPRSGEQSDFPQAATSAAHDTNPIASLGMPPTPDTVSTSTLRRFQTSNDALLQKRSCESPDPKASKQVETERAAPTEMLTGTIGVRNQRPSMSAFDGLRKLSDLPSRPGSEDEPAIVTRSGTPESDEQEDENTNRADGGGSLVSSVDPWMQESMRPICMTPLGPSRSAHSTSFRQSCGRVCPDLFSFPAIGDTNWGPCAGVEVASYKSWRTGESSTPAPLAETLDALADLRPTPVPGSAFAGDAAGTGRVGRCPPRLSMADQRSLHSMRGHLTRRKSTDSQKPSHASSASSSTAPPQEITVSQGRQTKARHYPITSSQTSRSRFNIFRRSLGSADTYPPAPSSAPAHEANFPPCATPVFGVPSRGRRSDMLDDFRASATPPPISKGRSGSQVATEHESSWLDPRGSVASVGVILGSATRLLPGQQQAGLALSNNAHSGGVRKWLGLGRSGSVRKNAG